jgi:alcohol dehydrogenase (cytochrome c)
MATWSDRSWLAGVLATALVTPALAAGETTAERLLNAAAEPQNWLTHHKDYAATRYSTLDEINAGKVNDLKVAWSFALGGIEGGGIWRTAGSRARQSSRTASCTSPTAGARSTSSI